MQDGDAQRRRADTQWQVFHRARLLSINHGSAAWAMRFKQPITPYGLAFLFSQPTTDPNAPTHRSVDVKAATKLWLAGGETPADPADPVDLLAAAVELLRARQPGTGWDVRTELANRCDDGMAPGAVYLGLAMSNLDTHTGTFAQVCQTVTSELGIAGTILYTAHDPDSPADQQVILADRRSAKEQNLMTIYSHRAFDTSPLTSPYQYREASLTWCYRQSGLGHLLARLHELDREIRAADHDRRALGTPPATSGDGAHRAVTPSRRDTRRSSR